ncbi:MAG: mannose-6-phosphate isomerase, class I [Proteobacteria bacterium]|nr:mannose-6-phosphate isomerase, class I [Pseudomonadota bacterium]
MNPNIVYLDAPIRPYAWGSHTTLAALQGRPHPTPQPEAEIWFGAHPVAPSLVGRDTGFVGLDALIAMSPRATLGPRLLSRFGEQLPFLLKILAIERPLSIQAHPDKKRARAGFVAETKRRIPLGAPQRIYKDPRPKPELVCALTSFDALVGFRPQGELDAITEALGHGSLPLEELVHDLLRHEDSWQRASNMAARNQNTEGVVGDAARTFAELQEAYPGDQGLAVAMLLNRVRLEPGQALFLGAGLLHAYLRGTAVEIMGNSDNTLRGGMTEKYVDVPELLNTVHFEPNTPEVLHAQGDGAEAHFTADTAAFSLSTIQLDEHYPIHKEHGPEIILCTSGDCTVNHGRHSVALGPGEACFVPHACVDYSLTGNGHVFRAQAGLD